MSVLTRDQLPSRSSTIKHLRKGATPMGAIKTMMIDSAYTQIGKYQNLPTHACMGLSDSKINDAQAGFETGIGAVMAALSGVNVASGPGMMNFESCQSLEKMVVDNEICGMAYRAIQGISQRDEPLAKNLFEGFTQESNLHVQDSVYILLGLGSYCAEVGLYSVAAQFILRRGLIYFA